MVNSMHFRVFSKGQGTESGIFWGLPKFIFFFWVGGGVLEIPDIFFFFFFGERNMLGPSLRMNKK